MKLLQVRMVRRKNLRQLLDRIGQGSGVNGPRNGNGNARVLEVIHRVVDRGRDQVGVEVVAGLDTDERNDVDIGKIFSPMASAKRELQYISDVFR